MTSSGLHTAPGSLVHLSRVGRDLTVALSAGTIDLKSECQEENYYFQSGLVFSSIR